MHFLIPDSEPRWETDWPTLGFYPMVLGSWTLTVSEPVQNRKLSWATLAVAAHPGGAYPRKLVPRRCLELLPNTPGSWHTQDLTRAALTLVFCTSGSRIYNGQPPLDQPRFEFTTRKLSDLRVYIFRDFLDSYLGEFISEVVASRYTGGLDQGGKRKPIKM